MDFNNNGKRKAQSIQDMINETSPLKNSGIARSGYKGPKGAVSGNEPVSNDFDVDRSASRWGNSDEGMPKKKQPRFKADVKNPMRGNFLRASLGNDLDADIEEDIRREKKERRERGNSSANRSAMSRRSSYKGPKRDTDFQDENEPVSYANLDFGMLGAIANEYGNAIFGGLLCLAVFITLIVSGVKPRNNKFVYPLNIISMTGVINDAYSNAIGMNNFAEVSDDDTVDSTALDAKGPGANVNQVNAFNQDDLENIDEDEIKPAKLDDGTMTFTGYDEIKTHDELVTAIDKALTNGDYTFLEAKLGYSDGENEEIKSYPISVVKHFTKWMLDNPAKRQSFVDLIKAEEYDGTNGTAKVIKLPLIKFTVSFGENSENLIIDNTKVKLTGFSEQLVSSNQDAAIYPLLPCMYTLTLTNNAWVDGSVTAEYEAKVSEGNLKISVGKDS